MGPTTGDGRVVRAAEPVASRSTEDEARDLLALRRAKRGDAGSFADLLRWNDDAVRAFLAALVGPDELDTVCTQVYLRAFRGLPIAPATSPRIWLLGIADGAARDVARRVAQSAGSTPSDEVPVPSSMPADERLVLAAVEAVGLTHRETSRLTDGGIDRVRDLLATARTHPGVRLPLPPTPPHEPRFWDDLGRRLLVEQSAPAATGRHRPVTIEGDDRTDDPAPTARTADVARGMAVRVEQQHPREFPWRRVGIALAVVVTAAALIGFVLTLAGHASRRDAGLGETASKTLNRLDAALARNTVVQGTVQITAADTTGVRSGVYQFARSNTGSWRLTATDGSVDEGYDVATATAASVVDPGTGPHQVTRRSGLAPGPPEATGVAGTTSGDVLANVIRAVRGGSAGSVDSRTEQVAGPSTAEGPTTTEERAIWVVSSTLDTGIAASTLAGSGPFARLRADEAELVADQSLALPTRLTLRSEGATVLTVQFSGLTISQQPAGVSYVPDVPVGATVETTDGGFVPAAAGEITGGSAPTPAYLPGGYVFAGAGIDRDRQTTVVCYRNGSRQLVLTTRPVPADPAAGTDPFTGGGPDDTDEVTVESGLFAGSTGGSALEPVPHVWVDGPRTQVVVAGDPPVDQLTKVIASLR